MTGEKCRHENLVQVSNVIAETYWSADGDDWSPDRSPDPTGSVCFSKVLSEDDVSWSCADCDAELRVSVNDATGKLEVEVIV